MPYELITAPVTTPVSLSEAKVQCKVESADTAEDAFILECIEAATNLIESEKDCQLMAATWDAFFDCWGDVTKIRKQPVQSVASIKYFDSDGVEQTLATSNYSVDTKSNFARIGFKDTFNPPTLESGRLNAITVRFVAGYADSDSVPSRIKQKILVLVRNFFDKRDGDFKVTKFIDSLTDNLSYEV